MKFLKKTAQILGITILLLVLFRGWIFRKTVHYTNISERAKIEITNKNLLAEIEKEKNKRDLSIEEIIEIAERVTNRNLKFTTKKVSNNPNEVTKAGKANCIGYAALFNAIGTYLIEEQNDEGKYQMHHLIGKLNFMGIDLHSFFSHPLFKDHDYNQIEILETEKSIYIDPSASDYLKIHQITSK